MPITSCDISQDAVITHPDLVNLYGCRIGAATRIGPFVEIQKGASVGARCKISSHSFICEGVTIEDEVMVAHGVMFTNGLLPRATNEDGSLQRDGDWECTPTLVRRGASIGSNATIVCGVTIGEAALVGAGAVVTRDVAPHAIVAGNPARKIGDMRHRATAPAAAPQGPRIMIRVGVIGYGYWGPNLARAVSEAEATIVEMVADMSPAARERAGRRHPAARLVADWADLIADPAVDAVMVATPVHTHYEIAMAALRAGKHVLVEKPMTDAVVTSARLVEEAARRRLVLMVDHTFVYTGAVQTISGLITSGKVGDIYYYDSTRVNLGLFQRDVNVIWDLAVHDFAVMDHLLTARPAAISASGAGFVAGRPENMAHLSVYYDDGSMAHLNVNWLAPVKVRRTMIGGSERMVVYDDMETSEKVKVYDRGVSLPEAETSTYEHMVSYRMGDMFAPAIPAKEALLTEVEEFARCVEASARPLTDGEGGLRVVEMLTAASRSMAMRGQPVELALDRIAS